MFISLKKIIKRKNIKKMIYSFFKEYYFIIYNYTYINRLIKIKYLKIYNKFDIKNLIKYTTQKNSNRL